MRLWSVIFGVLVGLHMAWAHPGWAQGDVGTLACSEVQLAVQSEVGNETNPPYRNHGAYVSAVANAANPAFEAGEITEACHECIVSQFAQSIPIGDQETCGPTCTFGGTGGCCPGDTCVATDVCRFGVFGNLCYTCSCSTCGPLDLFFCSP